MPQLSESGNHLGPTEELFNFLPVLDALLVTGMSGGTSVNGCAFLLPGNMGSDAEFSQIIHMVSGVVGLIGTNGDLLLPIAFQTDDHLLGCNPLCLAISLSNLRLGDEAVFVLTHGMPHDAEFGAGTRTLLVQPGIRISC